MINKQEIILSALVNKHTVTLNGFKCRLFQKGEYVMLPSGEYLVEDIPFFGIQYIKNETDVVWLGVEWDFVTILAAIDKMTEDEVIMTAAMSALTSFNKGR
jgi:hypothetical protein